MFDTTADVGSHLDHVVRCSSWSAVGEPLPTAPGVRELVEREWARYDDATVRTFLPVLVRRSVIDEVLRRQITEPVGAGVRITAG